MFLFLGLSILGAAFALPCQGNNKNIFFEDLRKSIKIHDSLKIFNFSLKKVFYNLQMFLLKWLWLKIVIIDFFNSEDHDFAAAVAHGIHSIKINDIQVTLSSKSHRGGKFPLSEWECFN